MSPLIQFTAWFLSLFFIVETPIQSASFTQELNNPSYDAMLQSINAANNYCKDHPGCSIQKINKTQDNFVEVSVQFKEAGGALAMLKKDRENYQFIQMYQEPPKCTLMKIFEVPQSFYGACYDDNGKLIE